MGIIGVHAIETAALKAWPAIETGSDNSWVLRASNGYTYRANSAQCLNGADDGDALLRLLHVSQWYLDRKLPGVFRLTPLASPRLLAAFHDEGAKLFSVFNRSKVLAMSLAGRIFRPDPRLELLPVDAENWLDAQALLQGYDDDQRAHLNAIVSRIEIPAVGLLLRGNDRFPLASALVTVADGIAFSNNVIIHEQFRRQGLGSALMRSGLAWAVENQANSAAIQVGESNAPALGLYTGLGFEAIYEYHYRRTPFPYCPYFRPRPRRAGAPAP